MLPEAVSALVSACRVGEGRIDVGFGGREKKTLIFLSKTHWKNITCLGAGMWHLQTKPVHELWFSAATRSVWPWGWSHLRRTCQWVGGNVSLQSGVPLPAHLLQVHGETQELLAPTTVSVVCGG